MKTSNANIYADRQIGRAITHSSLERKVWGSNLEPVKLAAGQIGHRVANLTGPGASFFESSCIARRNDVEMCHPTRYKLFFSLNERTSLF